MLRLSKMADYAGVIMAQMAVHPQDAHNASMLAERLSLPKATVAKCLKSLSKHGLLVSQRGAYGGYTLARAPDAVSVLDIIVAMDGPVRIASCTEGVEGDCLIVHSCPMRGGWDGINRDIFQLLQGRTLADLVK